ncbi:MAG: hypothetical protein ACOYOU_15125 [Kiritimatiellia bacterium]
MKTIIEKQIDGYAVNLEKEMITISTNAAPERSCNVSWFRTWEELSDQTRAHWSDKFTTANRTGLFAAPYDFALFRIRPIGDAVAMILEIQRAAAAAAKIERDQRDAAHAARAAAQAAIDAGPLAEMRAEEARLVALIPAGAVRCTITEHSDGDGGTYPTFSAEGVDIRDWHKCGDGWAYAMRPGAQNPFESVGVFYATREEIDAIKTAQGECAARAAAEKAKKDAARVAAFARARETGDRQELGSWTTDRCMNRHSDECSFDIATAWAMPNGTEKTTYDCCY